MTSLTEETDAEFNAMRMVYQALKALNDDARSRVLKYIIARLQVVDAAPGPPEVDVPTSEEAAIEREEAQAPRYGSLAELADATQLRTNAEKALVAGYWLQVCQGAENFDGFSANKELRKLGQGIGNITVAIDTLRNQNLR